MAYSRPAAHLIGDEHEALQLAQTLAAEFALEAGSRDTLRQSPRAQIERFSDSGLWGLTVPRQHGGAQVSCRTLAEVVRRIAIADPSLARLPQHHYEVVDLLRQTGSSRQQTLYFARILQGWRFSPACAEAGRAASDPLTTRIRFAADHAVLDGAKASATGILFAHIVPVSARDETGRRFVALVPRPTEGLHLIETGEEFGLRGSARGEVHLEQVRVDLEAVLAIDRTDARPAAAGVLSQLLHAAIDAGIAAAAFEDSLRHARQDGPGMDGQPRPGSDDLWVQAAVGDMSWQLHAAEALLELAADAVDTALAHPEDDTVTLASVAVTRAGILTREAALMISGRLFELAGRHGASARLDLDRHWRNARSHNLQGPPGRACQVIGHHLFDQLPPPGHGRH